MNVAEPERAWAPDLEPEWPPFEDTFPISKDACYVQKFGSPGIDVGVILR